MSFTAFISHQFGNTNNFKFTIIDYWHTVLSFDRSIFIWFFHCNEPETALDVLWAAMAERKYCRKNFGLDMWMKKMFEKKSLTVHLRYSASRIAVPCLQWPICKQKQCLGFWEGELAPLIRQKMQLCHVVLKSFLNTYSPKTSITHTFKFDYLEHPPYTLSLFVRNDYIFEWML